MRIELRVAPQTAAQTAAVVTLATGATLAAEILWTAWRRLPEFADVDASAVLGEHLDGPPVRVVVLGDSTLTGPGLTDPADIWIRRALSTLDLGRPVDLASFAVGGSRVADVRRRLAVALETPADAVILAVGANDALHGTPARQFATDFDRLLTEVLDRVPVAAVTNIGDLGNIVRIPAPLRSVARRRGRAFCRTIEQTVERHDGAVLLDVSPSDLFFSDRTLFGPDLFHPNSAGHSRWAEAVAPGLRAAFERLDQARVPLPA